MEPLSDNMCKYQFYGYGKDVNCSAKGIVSFDSLLILNVLEAITVPILFSISTRHSPSHSFGSIYLLLQHLHEGDLPICIGTRAISLLSK